MDRKQIEQWARQVGYDLSFASNPEAQHLADANNADSLAKLERFAALVAAAERESCAQVCDKLREESLEGDQAREDEVFEHAMKQAAKGIRARGATQPTGRKD